MSEPVEVLVFPLDCDKRQAMDAKQYHACQRSLEVLQEGLSDSEYGVGYKALVQKRIAEVQSVMTAIEKRYATEVV